jgi:hypothetical protein
LLASLRQRSALAAAAIITDETVIPQSDLYKLGGFRNLRGYREDQYSCERYVLLTIQPELRLARNALFHIFSDGAWFRESSGETLFRPGAGGGFEFLLPTGRLVLDLAWGRGGGFGDGRLYAILESRF